MRRMLGGLAFLVAMLLGGAVKAAPPTNETLRIAVHLGALRDASRADAEVSLKVWTEELVRILEVPAQVRFYDAIPEIRRDLDSDRVNFVIADGLDLLQHFRPDDLTDGFGGRSPKEGVMLLLARRGAGIRGARDLVGKRVVLLSDNAISELWLETYCLRHFGKSCKQAGLRIANERRSHAMILKLFFGQADVALVRGYSFELALEMNPQIRDHAEVLQEINIYPVALGLFGRRVSPAFREYVIAKVPQLHDQPRGRQLLEVMQTERVGRVPHSLLDPIRDLVREYETLSRRYATSGVRP
jgi:hypothetical protein